MKMKYGAEVQCRGKRLDGFESSQHDSSHLLRAHSVPFTDLNALGMFIHLIFTMTVR